jgi:hypothetical protein
MTRTSLHRITASAYPQTPTVAKSLSANTRREPTRRAGSRPPAHASVLGYGAQSLQANRSTASTRPACTPMKSDRRKESESIFFPVQRSGEERRREEDVSEAGNAHSGYSLVVIFAYLRLQPERYLLRA